MSKVQKKTKAPEELELPKEGFARLPAVCKAFGNISKTSLYEGIKDGFFPAPRRLTRRTVAWPVEEIRACIERIAAQNQ